MLFSMSTLHRSKRSLSFPKVSDCPRSQIRQTRPHANCKLVFNNGFILVECMPGSGDDMQLIFFAVWCHG